MEDLFLHFLQDIYYAEKHSVRAMAKMARSVENPELRQAILQHRDESATQIHRVEEVFHVLGKRVKAKSCEAMNGLVDETEEAIGEGEKGPVLDSALIACAQAIEHYEMARYGALIAWARTMGQADAANLLQQTLDEEKAADAKLNEIALRTLNPQAAGSEAAEAPEPEDKEEAEPEMEAPAETEAPAKRGRGRRAAPAKEAKAPPPPPPAPAKKPGRRASTRK